MERVPTQSGQTHFGEWLGLIRAEYLDMPGLHLTMPQARRLWGLDESSATLLMTALVGAKFLRQTKTGAYVLADRHTC